MLGASKAVPGMTSGIVDSGLTMPGKRPVQASVCLYRTSLLCLTDQRMPDNAWSVSEHDFRCTPGISSGMFKHIDRHIFGVILGSRFIFRHICRVIQYSYSL